MRIAVAALSLALAVSGATLVQAAPAAAAAARAYYNTTDTQLGVLLDTPATKAVLQKYIPDIVNSERIGMARGMTLKGLQPFTQGMLTGEKMAAIEADLAKVPAPAK